MTFKLVIFLLLVCAVFCNQADILSDDEIFSSYQFDDNDALDDEPTSQEKKHIVNALYLAAELEHTVMSQYLYAASSFKTKFEEFSHPLRKFAQYELVRQWKAKVLLVAREEMQHLSYVFMILDALKMQPSITHKAFPFTSALKIGNGTRIVMSLDKFDMNTLNKFIQFEEKHDSTMEHADVRKLNSRTASQFTIADLYVSIANSIKKWNLFGEHRSAINMRDVNDEFYFIREEMKNRRRRFNYAKVTRKVALGMIIEILENAGGILPSMDKAYNKLNEQEQKSYSRIYDEQSHKRIFDQIKIEYEQELLLDAEFAPFRQVVSNPQTSNLSRRADLVPSSTYRAKHSDFKTKSVAYRALDLFDLMYRTQLIFLQQWHTSNANPAMMHTMSKNIFFPYMSEIIAPMMNILSYIRQDDDPSSMFLGPSFSLKAFNLVQDRETLHQMQHDNLKTIVASTVALEKEISDLYPHLAAEYHFVVENVKLLQGNFQFALNTQENTELVNNMENSCIDSRFNASTVFDKQAQVLVFKFKGFFSCRLATNPDNTAHSYGISGKTYAPVGTAPFDRVIRFQDETGKYSEEFSQPVGVHVTQALLVKDSTNAFAELNDSNSVDLSDKFKGSLVSLLDNPKFESRNGLFNELNELIDPFTIQIRSQDSKSFVVQRGLGTSKPYVDHTTLEQLFIQKGRGPYQYAFTNETILKNLQGSGIANVVQYVEQRYETVKDAYNKLLKQLPSDDPQVHQTLAQYKLRLYGLEKTLGRDLQDKQSNDRLVGLKMYRRRFTFALNGKTIVNGMNEIGNVLSNADACSAENRWVVDFDMFFYDYDTKVAIVEGQLFVPIVQT